MSSRIAPSLEAQASVLVSFLSQAQHALALDAALEICDSMRAAKEPAARFLKAALANQRIELKHTSCLKALALMEGFEGHVARPKPSWVVARYIFDAPAITPKVKNHSKSTDATADLCARLAEDLADSKDLPYVQVVRNADYLEFIVIGEPQPGARYILACKSPDGSASEIEEAKALNAVERVRRLVEGQFRGWLDGAAKIPADIAGTLRLLKDGQPMAEGLESEILAACERDDDFDDTGLETVPLLTLPVSARRYRVFHVTAGDVQTPADEVFVERLWRRLEGFYRKTTVGFSLFVSRRLREQNEGRFHYDGIDTGRLVVELAKQDVTVQEAKAIAGMSDEEWSTMMEREEVPRETLLKLAGRLQLPANALYEDLRNSPWMPVVDGEEIALWMRNFDHMELSVSGVAEGAPLAQRSLDRLTRLHHGVADPVALQAVLAEAGAAGLRLCATIRKQFVSDLPIPRERLAMVGQLSFWDRKEIDSWAPSATQVDEDESQPWTQMDEEYLGRFNAIDMTLEDLIALQEEVARARRDGQEPGWETATFAAARAFRGRPDAAHRAHTAVTRMTAMSHLIERGALAVWMEESDEPGVSLVPQNVLHAAARCPMIRAGGEPGFEVAAFRRLALELAR
jgi:hypothetical protein